LGVQDARSDISTLDTPPDTQSISQAGKNADETQSPKRDIRSPQTLVASLNTQTTRGGNDTSPEIEQDVWALALQDLSQSNRDIILALEPSLAPDYGADASVTRDQNVAKTALTNIEGLRDAKIATRGKSAQFRDYFEQTVKLAISANAAISFAVAFNPIAASAWTCVSTVLPLFTNSTTENDAAIEGLNYITILLSEYKWKQRIYLSEGGDASQDFIARARKLYTSILEYEALLCVHLRHPALKRFQRNLLKAGDWKDRLNSLKQLDSACRKVTEVIEASRAYQWQTEEQEWQQKLLDQPRKAEDKANLQALYSNYESAKNFNEVRIPGTCEWLLKHPVFLTWRESRASCLLWLTADPGCGKSVLARYLIDRKGEVLSGGNTERSAICYFFFKDGDPQRNSASKAVCALLYQLFLQQPHLYNHAAPDFDQKGERFLTDFDPLWRIFAATFHDSSVREMICVLDGLDECEAVSRTKLIQGLVDLQVRHQRISGENGVIRKVLTTSRPYGDLEDDFRDLTDNIAGIRLSGETESEAIRQEVNLVLKAKITTLARRKRLSSQVKRALEGRLSKIEHRTYLWLSLMLKFLETRDEIREDEIPELLKMIPNDIEDAYHGILKRIKQPQRARSILHAVLGAAEALSLSELNVFMNVDKGPKNKGDIKLWETSAAESLVKSICGLFVTVVNSKVYLIHQTAREFLISKDRNQSAASSFDAEPTGWKETFRAGESAYVMAQSCISFLSLDDFGNEGLTARSWKMRNTKAYAAFGYAARHWAAHLANANLFVTPDLARKVTEKLYRPKAGHRFKLWLEVYQSASEPYSCFPANDSNLLWAARFGQTAVVKHILDLGYDCDLADKSGRTALFFAAYGGHLETVNVLLTKGADAIRMDLLEQSPVFLAFQGRHSSVKSVSKALLAATVHVDHRDVFNRTALEYCDPKTAESLDGELAECFTMVTKPSPEGKSGGSSSSITVGSATDLSQIEQNIQRYLTLAHGTGQWKVVDEHNLLRNTKTDRPSGLSELYDSIKVGVQCLSRDTDIWYNEIRDRFSTALASIRQVIEAETSILLVFVARLIVLTTKAKLQRLAIAICRRMLAVASKLYDAAHPLVTILSQINEYLVASNADFGRLASSMLETCVKTWSTLLTPEQMQVVYVKHIQLEVLSKLEGPQHVAEQLETLSASTDRLLGEKAIESLQRQADVAQNRFDCGNYDLAKAAAEKLYERISGLHPSVMNNRHAHLRCEGLRTMAASETQLLDFTNADEHYRILLEEAENCYGVRQARYQEYRREYGLWLLDRGRIEDARQYGV